MSIKAGEIIDAAKLMAHPVGFTTQVSTTQLLAHISNEDNQITQLTNQVMPSLASESGDVATISDALNQVGYDLYDATGYTEFKLIKSSSSSGEVWEIYIVMESDFMNPARHPAAMIVQGIGNSRLLLPVDPLGKNWSGGETRDWWKPGDTVQYRFIPLPTQLTKVTQSLTSPNVARNYLVQSTALLILQMIGGDQAQIELSQRRVSHYYNTLLMQLHKQSRIRTPHRVSEDTFYYPDETMSILTR